jgi:hypothetical protein
MCAALLQCGPALRYGAAMKPVPRWFVAVCWALAALFSLSAGLQVNDPDPAGWFAIYMAAALAVGLLPGHRATAPIAIAVGLIAAAWGAYLGKQVFGQIGVSDLWLKMSEKGGAVEVGREAAGLAIVAVAALSCGAFRALRA